MIVLDASAAIELLLLTPRGVQIGKIAFETRGGLHAPEVFDLEVTQVLRRYERAGQLEATRAGQAFDDLRDLSLERWPHSALMQRIWQLRDNFSAYDGAYIALAEALGAQLLSCDRALAGPGHAASIVIID